jgi:hypothetical protein
MDRNLGVGRLDLRLREAVEHGIISYTAYRGMLGKLLVAAT